MFAEGSIHKRMGLPESAIVEIDMEVVGIINEEGQLELRFRCETDTVSYATGIGLLEQAKATLTKEWEFSS